MKNTRKFISVLLAVVMVMSMMSIIAIDSFAVTSEDGLWDYTVLDDGTVLEIKDLFAFCEYVENKW